ncbi:hypothetical protein Tco_1453682 [Tanacetum coccineum]
MQEPPSPEFALEPVYPEFMPPEDEAFPAEEQALPAAVSPTADLPGYIADSDLEEDPEEDPTDYPADEGDNDDDDDESSDDDEDDNDDVEEDEEEEEEEEEEHLAPADSVPSPAYQVDRLLAISTLLPSPLTSYSSTLPQIPSPPLPVSSPLPISPPPLPASHTHPLGYRAVMIRLRAEVDVLEVTLPPRKRLCIAPGLRFEVEECSSAPTARPTRGFRADHGFIATLDAEIRRDPERDIGYGITNVWVDPDEIAEGIPATDVAELSQRMTNFVTTVRQDTDEIYGRLGDAQDDRLLMSGQLNSLRRDRRSHARTARFMETEARLSHEAWVQSMDASDTARSEVRALWTTVLAHQTKIEDLRVADHK